MTKYEMRQNNSTRLLRLSSLSGKDAGTSRGQSGKISFNMSNSSMDTKSYVESMENQLSSSGTFSSDILQ